MLTGDVHPPTRKSEDVKGRDQSPGATDGISLGKVGAKAGRHAIRVLIPSEPRPGAIEAVEETYLNKWLSEKCCWEESVSVQEGAGSAWKIRGASSSGR